jgi:transcriptional regulator with XRE-family HTH domain
LAKNVREAREKMRMSQSDLSRATGLSRQAIHQLENGLSRCPSACNALLIAKALETSVEELLKSHCKRRVDQYVIQYDYRDYERRMRMEARGAEE